MIMNVKNIKDPNFLKNLENFGKVLENDRLHEATIVKNNCIHNIELCEVSLIEGRKYIKVLIGDSVYHFIDKVTGDIFGRKDSKTINKKHYYGNIFNCEARWWGFYCNTNKNYNRDTQNLLTVSNVVEEMQQAEVKPEPATEQKTNNSNCVVKFVNDKIIVQFNDSILNQDQAKLQLLTHNGFTYDYDNKIFVADNNDFMKNLLIKLEFLEGELIKVRKTRKEPFKIKEMVSNQIVEKNNSENKPVEQKDDSTNNKNIIFVDFKNKKSINNNVAPESIKIIIDTDNHGSETFYNWKPATSVYNAIIDFLQYCNEDDREDTFYISVIQGNKEYFKKFNVSHKTEQIKDLKEFLIKDTISDIEFFKNSKVGKEYINKINPKHLEKLKKELDFLSSLKNKKIIY